MNTPSTAAMPNSTSLTQPFRFLDLPTELRLQIYGYALVGPHDTTLRSPSELQTRKDRHRRLIRLKKNPKICTISLLLASKKISAEALPILYDTNSFHYTILPAVASVQGVLSHFLLHLHLMQHVSIDYTLHTSASDVSEADRLVSTRTRSVRNGCPNLRTFTLHLLTFFRNDDLYRKLSAGGETASELATLAARLEDRTYCLEWISVVAHGDIFEMVGFLSDVAPFGEWVTRIAHKWPFISIYDCRMRGIEILGSMESWEYDSEDGDADRTMYIYHLWPALCRRCEELEKELLDVSV